MNARAWLPGLLGVVVGVAAGLLAGQKIGARKAASTVFVTNAVYAPRSTFMPIRDPDAPPGRTFKTPGKVSFEEFPDALASVLAESSSRRYQSLFDLSS